MSQVDDRVPVSPAARQQLQRVSDAGILHRSAFRDRALHPLLQELLQSTIVVELEGGYLTTDHAIERLLGVFEPAFPADSRTLADTIGCSRGSTRALLSHLVRSGVLAYQDGTYSRIEV